MARKQKRWQDYWHREVVNIFVKRFLPWVVLLFIDGGFVLCEAVSGVNVLYLTTGTSAGYIGHYYYSDEYGGFANDIAQSFAVDEDGKIYLADTFNNRVQVFTNEGKFLFLFPTSDSPRVGSGYNITIGWDKNVYVSEISVKKGYTGKYNAKNGKMINAFARPGNGTGEYWHADQICADIKGDVYIYDMNLSKIEKYSKDGKYLGALADKGFFTINPDGHLYIKGMYGIKIYDTNKSFIKPERVMINLPLLKDVVLLKVDKIGNFYCYDGETKISKISPAGSKIIDEVEILSRPVGNMIKNIDIGNDGNVYVANSDYDNAGRIFLRIDKYILKN